MNLSFVLVMSSLFSISYCSKTNNNASNSSSEQRPTDDASSNPADDAPLKFTDVASIVQESCATAGCHNGAEMFSLATREDFFRRKPRPLNAILRGSMPKDNPDFSQAAEGKLLIQWLNTSQEQ